MQATREQHHKWLIEFYDVVPKILSKRDCTTDIIWSMHGAWSDLTLRYNYSFLAVTCSFLLTPFRGAMWIRRQNANIWKEKPSHWHHTVANIEKTRLGSGFFYNFGFGLKSSHGFMHPVFYFWLVQTSRTLRVGGEPRCLSALLCIARIPDFKRVVLPGVAHFWSVFFVVEGLETSFRVRISLSFFHFLRIGMGWRKQFGANGLRSQTAHCSWTPGTDSFGFADGWHQCESEYGGAIGVVGDVLDAKRSGSQPRIGFAGVLLQVFGYWLQSQKPNHSK